MRTMTPIEQVVRLATVGANDRTSGDTTREPGAWYGHFIDALREAGYEIVEIENPDFDAISEQQGWNAITMLSVVRSFVAQDGASDRLNEYAAMIAQEEIGEVVSS